MEARVCLDGGGEVARGAAAPFWARKRLCRVEVHAGIRPRPGGWACKCWGGAHIVRKWVHTCLPPINNV